MCEAYFQWSCKNINHKQYEALINQIEVTVMTPYLSKIQDYLLETIRKATPEAIRGAKKSKMAYMEQLIHFDCKAGKIALHEAYSAKEMLHGFLNPNPDENPATDGQAEAVFPE